MSASDEREREKENGSMKLCRIATSFILSLLLAGAGCACLAEVGQSEAELRSIRKMLEEQSAKRLTLQELRQSIDALTKFIEKHPQSAEAFYLRGSAYEQVQDMKRALSDFDRSIALNPKHGKSYWNRGVLLLFENKLDDALSDFNHAIEYGEKASAVYSNRGVIRLNKRDFKGALSDFDTALTLSPDSWVAKTMRLAAYYELERYNDVAANCTELLTNSRLPESEHGYVQKFRGLANLRLGNYQKAVVDLTSATNTLQGEEKARAIDARATAHEKLGQKEEASRDRQLAQKLRETMSEDLNREAQFPKDKPFQTRGNETEKLEAAIKPLIEQARKSLAHTKERYEKGLPRGHVLMVTTRLHGQDGSFEQVFVKVDSWHEHSIDGTLASDVKLRSHKIGEKLTVKEEDVIDWTILNPDGSEEGNVIGKFLDNWKPSDN